MSRRRFKPQNLSTGAPVIPDGRRGPTRRRYRQLSPGKFAKKPPVLGTIYRTMTPSSVADYEGISDSTWSSGTLGTYTVGTGTFSYTMIDWNVLYFHYINPNPNTASQTYLLNPIRWSCDIPTTNGGNYDHWYQPGISTTVPPVRSGRDGHYGGLVDTILPSSGASHIELQATTRVHVGLGPVVFDVRSVISLPKPMGGYKQVGNTFNNRFAYPNLESISPTTIYMLRGNYNIYSYAADSVEIAYFRHRVNGSAVGDLHTWGAGFTIDSCDVALADGDTYELDIWYRVRVAALSYPFLYPGPAKGAIALPVSRVTNSSHRTLYPKLYASTQEGQGESEFIEQRRVLGFSNVNVSPDFDRTLHTYQLTIPGGLSWTLPGGTAGPEKMANGNGWQVTFGDWYVSWQNISQSDNPVLWIVLSWYNEIAELKIKFKSAFASSEGFNINHHASYTPQSDGTYRTSTVNRNESATITHIPSGCFNQSGTTTFSLVEWTPTYVPRQFVGASWEWGTYEGKRSGVLPFYPNIPTSITVARTTQ